MIEYVIRYISKKEERAYSYLVAPYQNATEPLSFAGS